MITLNSDNRNLGQAKYFDSGRRARTLYSGYSVVAIRNPWQSEIHIGMIQSDIAAVNSKEILEIIETYLGHARIIIR